MNRNRIAILGYVLVLVAAIAAAGWAVSSRIESPAEAAARTAPPSASPILVPIETRVLSSNVVTRGTARFGLPQPISVAPSTLKSGPGLITTLPALNKQFKEGDVLLTASGRPFLVLQGEIPAYRDLAPGASGNDVRQLEQALERLGFDPGPVDGNYDERTSAAVAEWYKSAGYEPFGPTPTQVAALRALETSLGDATKSKLAAAGVAASAQLAVDSARAKVAYANKAAAAETSTKIAERALVALDPRQTGLARSAADEKLDTARLAVKSAKLEGEVAVKAALEAQQVAEFDANLTAERASQLAVDLEIAKAKLGVQVPLDEIVFIPALPVRVEAVNVPVGASASGQVISVTDNQITIDAALPLEAAPLVKPGMNVTIDEQALGIKVDGVVETVDNVPGTHGVDGYHIYMAVRVGETPTPLQGYSLRMTIPIESTKGTVTTVPISALSLAADGSSRIQVENNGTLKFVPVNPGLSAEGFVEVTPVDGKLEAGQMVVIGFEDKANQTTKL